MGGDNIDATPDWGHCASQGVHYYGYWADKLFANLIKPTGYLTFLLPAALCPLPAGTLRQPSVYCTSASTGSTDGKGHLSLPVCV